MQIILQSLQENDTPFEYTITGLELGNVRCEILAKNLAVNTTLKSVHVARKGINESSGISMAKMLNSNKTLRKLELEGNLMGPKSATEFGKALKTNKTLKFLDLESNQLTLDGQEFRGIYDLVEFLDHNTTLLSLNLANNQMDEECGRMFREKMETNLSLIDFDFSMNNFSPSDSRAIQDYLKRNKEIYDAERLKEWIERKHMRDDDEQMKELQLHDQSKKQQNRMEDEAREIREQELNEKWKKFMLETEIEKQQIIQ